LFTQQLEQQLERSRKTQSTSAVLFVDLDLFKVINDSLGHVVGDQLLIAAGKRISESIGKDDLAARISGDEFTILLPDLPSRDRAVEVAKALVEAFGVPFNLGPHVVFTTASVGVAFSEPADSPVNLIRHADIAMYRDKALG